MIYNLSSAALLSIDWNICDKNVVWLDYDQPLKKFMLEDIKTLLTMLSTNNMFFISINCSFYRNSMPKERYQLLESELGNYFPNYLKFKDFTNPQKNNSLKKIIDDVIADTLNRRNSGKEPSEQLHYYQLIYFLYKDGAEMLTIGGILTTREEWEEISRTGYFNNLPFLVSNPNASAFSLELPHLTYKEASHLLTLLPTEDLSTIDLPWFTTNDIQQISILYRYIPLYLEANTFG